MSRANAQLARRWMEAINRRDPDAMDRLVHRDYELHNPWTPGGGVHHGVDAVKSFGRGSFDTWEVYAVEEERIIEAGETMVALAHVRAKGKASGVTLDGPLAHVHTVRDGRLARTQVFLDHGEALEAAGLLE
jgi:ketosteroid isomerase-like protein